MFLYVSFFSNRKQKRCWLKYDLKADFTYANPGKNPKMPAKIYSFIAMYNFNIAKFSNMKAMRCFSYNMFMYICS